jgi:hypothetical protein
MAIPIILFCNNSHILIGIQKKITKKILHYIIIFFYKK